MGYFVTNKDCNFIFEEDKLGMTITSGCVKITKSENNLIGISVGGGAPYCPCIYIVQIFDNIAVAKNGVLETGDEIIAINGENVKGKTRANVAKLIKESDPEVVIKYNKLHINDKQGKDFDIILKRIKHRIVENISSSTADSLGLSRAILCNDSLAKKIEELEKIEFTYKGLVEHIKYILKGLYDLNQVYKKFGDIFSEIGVKEQQPTVCETFRKFGDNHRLIEKNFLEVLRKIKIILKDLITFLTKVIPDTKLTFKKYVNTKLDYLSYCLKIREMDDEELAYQNMNELLIRVETGNYKYRLILRCRQQAKEKFIKMRTDVLIKLDLLGQRYFQNITCQLQNLIKEFHSFYNFSHNIWKDSRLFPIEIDLPKSSLNYIKNEECSYFYHDEEEDEHEDEYKDENNDEHDKQEMNKNIEKKDKDLEPCLLKDFEKSNLNRSNSELNKPNFNDQSLI